MDCIIVGGGAAGFQAAIACRSVWPEKAVTVIDAENECGYYRTLLPQFMVGALPEEKLFFPQGEADPLLKVRTGVRVKTLDRKGNRLLLDNGETLSYDRLILAHGGNPYLPGILAGPPCKGIFPVRDLTTARATKAWLAEHRQIIVFGGSLVGVKTAVHLNQAGFDVSLIVRRGHILLRALSPEAAQVVEAHMVKMGDSSACQLTVGGHPYRPRGYYGPQGRCAMDPRQHTSRRSRNHSRYLVSRGGRDPYGRSARRFNGPPDT